MKVASEEDIIKIMSMGTDKNDRAIITLILSSGLPSKFIEEMTYEQLLDACDHYFRFNESKSISNLVKKNPRDNNLIACFDYGKKSRPRMTCCSPESLQLIIEYLRYRGTIKIDSDEDYVFLNYKNEPIINKDHISTMFRRARDKASRYLPKDVTLDIKSAYVRNRFKDICNNHLEGPYKNNVLTLMGVEDINSKSDNKKFYEYVKNNRGVLIDHYLTVVDDLTLRSSTNQVGRRLNNFTTNIGF